MISCEEALATILDAASPMPAESCPKDRAQGRILAKPVTSAECLPPFDNSAMDGFALYAASELPAGSEFDVTGMQVAGDVQAPAAGGTWEIMTGAQMPDGFNTVVPIERVSVLARSADGRPRRIRLEASVQPGQHRRRRGQDVSSGQLMMTAGERIGPHHSMLLAAVGVAEVQVVRPPRVAVITTGSELETDPVQSLAPGRIRNSNGPLLAARVAAAGADLVHQESVDDDPAKFAAALERALQAGAEVVVSTGAVSMGVHDFVPATLRGLGADIRFHKLAMRPGKPLLFARLAGGALHFGLPGNPASAAVGFRFFVEPALRAMLGMPRERPLRLPLAAAFEKHAPLRFYLKGRLLVAEGGQLRAKVMQGQGSFRILSMLRANAWVTVPADIDRFEAGDLVEVHGLSHLEGLRLGDADVCASSEHESLSEIGACA